MPKKAQLNMHPARIFNAVRQPYSLAKNETSADSTNIPVPAPLTAKPLHSNKRFMPMRLNKVQKRNYEMLKYLLLMLDAFQNMS